MSEVAYICQGRDRQFSLAEVDSLIPLLTHITLDHERKIKKYMADQRFYITTKAPQSKVSEQDSLVSRELTKWGHKMIRLGARVYSNGYLGFNSGFGYFSWRVGESPCTWYHEFEVDPNTSFRRKLTRPLQIV